MQVAIPIYDRFTALDAIGPYDVLSRIPGAEVVFCAAEARPHRTENGMFGAIADKTLDEVAEPEIVVVPGGFGTRAIANDDGEIVRWLKRVHETTQFTTSVCTGALLLGAAGLLAGLEATTYWNERESLRQYGATPVADRVVEQGKVWTAAGVSAGIDMALLLVERLHGPEAAQAIQLGIEYDPQPPHDTGSPEKAPPELVEAVRATLRRENG